MIGKPSSLRYAPYSPLGTIPRRDPDTRPHGCRRSSLSLRLTVVRFVDSQLAAVEARSACLYSRASTTSPQHHWCYSQIHNASILGLTARAALTLRYFLDIFKKNDSKVLKDTRLPIRHHHSDRNFVVAHCGIAAPRVRPSTSLNAYIPPLSASGVGSGAVGIGASSNVDAAYRRLGVARSICRVMGRPAACADASVRLQAACVGFPIRVCESI